MIKFIIAKGIGFSPGSTQYVPTHGFGTGAASSVSGPVCLTAGYAHVPGPTAGLAHVPGPTIGKGGC